MLAATWFLTALLAEIFSATIATERVIIAIVTNFLLACTTHRRARVATTWTMLFLAQFTREPSRKASFAKETRASIALETVTKAFITHFFLTFLALYFSFKVRVALGASLALLRRAAALALIHSLLIYRSCSLLLRHCKVACTVQWQ